MKKLDTEGVRASKVLLCRSATSPACLDGHDHSSTESFPTPKCVCTSGGSRISPRRGRQLSGGAPTYDFAKFSQKLHEIERIWTPGGGHASKILLCRSATVYKSHIDRFGKFKRLIQNHQNNRLILLICLHV